MPEGEVTADGLLRGRVRLFQPARGPRASLDPILLAGFLTPPYGRFLDIGCGTGAVAFLLLARDPAARGVGVELQPALAELALRGRDENGWSERLEIVEADVRALGSRFGDGGFDLVATNPPYRTLGANPPSPIRARALAHHEIALSLPEWIAVAARAVRRGGRVAAILPRARADEAVDALGAQGLMPTRLRFVRPYARQPESRVLIEAKRGPRDDFAALVEPPLIVHEPGGGFTGEVRRMLGED